MYEHRATLTSVNILIERKNVHLLPQQDQDWQNARTTIVPGWHVLRSLRRLRRLFLSEGRIQPHSWEDCWQIWCQLEFLALKHVSFEQTIRSINEINNRIGPIWVPLFIQIRRDSLHFQNQIRELELRELRNIDVEHQLQLIICCPHVERLIWAVDPISPTKSPMPVREFANTISEEECCPKLSSTKLEDSTDLMRDEDLALLVEGDAGFGQLCLQVLLGDYEGDAGVDAGNNGNDDEVTILSRAEQDKVDDMANNNNLESNQDGDNDATVKSLIVRTMDVLDLKGDSSMEKRRSHTETLEIFKMRLCPDVTGPMLLKTLGSCPNLKQFSGNVIRDKDIFPDGAPTMDFSTNTKYRPWKCLNLWELECFFEIHGPAQSRQVWLAIRSLQQLDILEMGFKIEQDEIGADRTLGLFPRLEYGLNELIKRLSEWWFEGCTHLWMETEDAHWIATNLTNMKCFCAIMNKFQSKGADLKLAFAAKGIDTLTARLRIRSHAQPIRDMSLSRRQKVVPPESARLLVTRVTGFKPRDPHFDACLNYVGLQLFDINGLGGNRNKAQDHTQIDKRLQGLAEKFSIKNQTEKGDALEDYLVRVRKLARSLVAIGGGTNGDTSSRTVIATSNMDQEEAAQNVVSSLLVTMLELSETPTLSKRGESRYKVPMALKESKDGARTQEQINRDLWRAILAEDPLVGEHWQSQPHEAPSSSQGRDSDSDFEDMEVHEKPVPGSSGAQLSATRSSPPEQTTVTGPSWISNLDLWTSANDSNSIVDSAQIKALQRQQYFHGETVLSKPVPKTAPAQDTTYDIQSPTGLNAAAQECAEYRLTGKAPIMDEVDIIHEVLMLLQGLPTVLFTLDNQGTAKFTSKFAVSHLSLSALQSILEPLLTAAGEIREVQRAVDSICSARSHRFGKIIQTFASGVHVELGDLKWQLAALQQKYQRNRKSHEQHVASLLELHANLSDPLSLVRQLLEFIRQCAFYNDNSESQERWCQYSSRLLSDLYEKVCQSRLCGESQIAGVFYRLLKLSIRPFLRNTECWLSGLPLDSENEFMIRMSPNIDLFANQYWSEGFKVETEHIEQREAPVRIRPSFLSETSLDQALYTGKAIRITDTLLAEEAFDVKKPVGYASSVFNKMFEGIGVSSDLSNSGPMDLEVPTTTTTSFAKADLDFGFPKSISILDRQCPILSAINPTLAHSQNGGISLHAADSPSSENYTLEREEVDIQWRMESILSASIEEQYKSANSLLKSIIFTRCKLKWHLKGMAEFYFMMQGEIMHSYSTDIFTKIRRKRNWYDIYVLGSTFDQSAAFCDWQHAKFVNIKIGSSQGVVVKGPSTFLSNLQVQLLDTIEFEYLLPWPLGGIVYSTPNAKRMFGRITSLLFQVRVAKHAMELSSFLKSKPTQTPELGLFWKLRLRFLSAINDLWSYFMMTVLDVQVQKFHAEIEKQGDMDDMIRLSQRFIRVCYERCFLKDRTVPLHRSMMTMLNLALQFSTLFSKFIRDQEKKRRKEAEAAAADHVTRSRRASLKLQRPGYEREENSSSDSDENSEDEDDEEEEFEAEDEDMELDDSETGLNRSKKQKVDGDLSSKVSQTAGSSTLLSSAGPAQPSRQGTVAARKRAHQSSGPSSVSSSPAPSRRLSYREQLEAIELEFDRCRAFLAKSLKVVVNANAARGYSITGGGVGKVVSSTVVVDSAEGGSNYLDGLILALST
ncbi:Gamma-tubulin complex component 5 [Gryganskiella cystojenkinii]|nr:Gamma-tubulin complex component 5 [Gryganskiella cystojenkinii]